MGIIPAPAIDIVLVIAAVIGLIVGPFLILRARRRGRMDEHPFCAACGFDQFGRPESSTRCAECGADLAAPGAIVQVHHNMARTRIGYFIAASALLLTLFAAQRIAGKIEWIRHVPLSWVLYRAESSSKASRMSALSEVWRRGQASELDAAGRSIVIDRVLAIHADPAAYWADWQWFVEQWMEGGWPTNAQLERLLQQSFRVSLSTKGQFRRGRPVAVRMEAAAWRPLSNLQVDGRWTASDLRIDGRLFRQRLNWQVYHLYSPLEDTNNEASFIPEWPQFADVADGRHQLMCNMRFSLAVTYPQRTGAFVFDIPASTTVDVVADTVATDTFKSDPALAAAMHAGFLKTRIMLDADGTTLYYRYRGLPAKLAVNVVAVQGGREMSMGLLRIVDTPRDVSAFRVRARQPITIVPGIADVILRPSQLAADGTSKAGEYWGDPILLKDVPVIRPEQVEFVRDETLRDAVERSIAIKELVVVTESFQNEVKIKFAVRSPPVRLVFRTVVRANGTEIGLPPSPPNDFLPGAEIDPINGYYLREPFPNVTKVDVILRPHHNWEFIPDPDSYAVPWGNDIVIRDVPVVHGPREGNKRRPGASQ